MKSESKKRSIIKHLIVIVSVIVSIIFFDLFIGLIIGGHLSKHLFAFVALSIIISAISLLAISGKEKFKSKKAPWLMVGVIAFFIFVSFAVSYDFLNLKTSNPKYEEYQSTVTTTVYSRDNFFEVFFTDKNGNEANDKIFTLKYIILSDEEEADMLKAGDTITVREYQGGFGYPIYRISELHNN